MTGIASLEAIRRCVHSSSTIPNQPQRLPIRARHREWDGEAGRGARKPARRSRALSRLYACTQRALAPEQTPRDQSYMHAWMYVNCPPQATHVVHMTGRVHDRVRPPTSSGGLRRCAAAEALAASSPTGDTLRARRDVGLDIRTAKYPVSS